MPFFRGKQFDGHVSGATLEDSWPKKGPPVLWNRELGQGYSSFSFADDRIFTQYQTTSGQYVVCLNASTGKTIWEYRYDWPYKPMGLYPGPRSTPTLDGDGHLFLTSPGGSLFCLRQKDGKLVWKVDFQKEFDSKPVDFGYACSPVVIQDQVLIPVGGKDASVVSFCRKDGKVHWKSGNFEISYASLLPITRSGRSLLVAYLKNDLVLFDATDGEVLASRNLSSGYDEHSAWPIYEEPYLWISAPFRKGSQLLEITESIEDGQRKFSFYNVWNSIQLSNDVCSSVLVDGHLFGFDLYDVQSKVHRPSRGQFQCIELKTGKVKWSHGNRRARRRLSQNPELDDPVGHCSVLYCDQKLVLFSDTGELILLKANPERFHPLERINVLGGEIQWTQPALLEDGRFLVRNHSQVACILLANPEKTPLLSANEEVSTVSDLPKEVYWDWASLILSVEPEYAMDAPTFGLLLQWFLVLSIVPWAILFPLSFGVSICVRFWKPNTKIDSWNRGVFRVLAIGFGLAGTTLVSHLMDEFIFTWPLVLAMVFEVLVFQLKDSKSQRIELDDCQNPAHSTWAGRITMILFLSLCIVYFYFCRRLSLAFEWSFLLGFPAALPFLLWVRKQSIVNPKSLWRPWIGGLLSFSGFYWTGAGLILYKYW